MTFEEALATLRRVGIDERGIGCEEEWRGDPPNREPHELPFFKSIHIQFSPEEWCGLCMKEGQFYIGGCCAQTSHAQDIMNKVFRFDSGLFNLKDMANIAELLGNHDHGPETPNFEELGDIERAIANWVTLDPWQKLAFVWHVVKEHYIPEKPNLISPDKAKVECASAILRRGLDYLAYDNIFGKRELRPSSQRIAGRLLTLYRLLPALKIFCEKVSELNLGPFQGYALVDKKDQNNILINRYGYCVFDTREETEGLLNIWRSEELKLEEKPKELIDDRITIRKVMISAEKGLEFIE